MITWIRYIHPFTIQGLIPSCKTFIAGINIVPIHTLYRLLRIVQTSSQRFSLIKLTHSWALLQNLELQIDLHSYNNKFIRRDMQ